MRKWFVVLLAMGLSFLWVNGAYAQGQYGQIICEAANMREEPSVTAGKVKRIKNGEVFEILGEIADAKQERQENEEVVMWYKVRYDDEEGFLKQDLVVNAGDYLITRREINLYATPWDSCDKRTGELTKDSKLLLIAEDENWYAVSYGMRSGFIRKDAAVWTSDEIQYYLSLNSTKGETNCETTIRTGPGEDWPKIANIEEGEDVKLVASENDWYVMVYQDGIAYIKKSDVTI